MTIIDKFHDWQRCGWDWDAPPFEACSPNLLALRDWLLDAFGGASLGCHGDRDIRGGSLPSSHAFGAALDWRYQDPGPGRDRMLADVLPFVIGHSAELGIQAIHDYAGDRIWRPPGHSGRPAGGDGWKTQNGSGAAMGAPWALWLHLEVHPDAFGDARPVDEKITPPPPTPEQADTMIAIDYKPGTPDWTALVYTGTHLAHVFNGHADEVLRAAKVERVEVGDSQLDGLIRSAETTTPCPPAWRGSERGALWGTRRS